VTAEAIAAGLVLVVLLALYLVERLTRASYPFGALMIPPDERLRLYARRQGLPADDLDYLLDVLRDVTIRERERAARLVELSLRALGQEFGLETERLMTELREEV